MTGKVVIALGGWKSCIYRLLKRMKNLYSRVSDCILDKCQAKRGCYHYSCFTKLSSENRGKILKILRIS